VTGESRAPTIFHRDFGRNARAADFVRDDEANPAVLEFLVAGKRFKNFRARKSRRQSGRKMMSPESGFDFFRLA
jgi:hypothetical protein